MRNWDFIVVGGGIAGVSAAAHLAPYGSTLLLEAESSLAYHTTGRSAAVYVVNYGGLASRPLAVASRSFFDSPPAGSTDALLLSDRGVMWIAGTDQTAQLEKLASEASQLDPSVQLLDQDQTLSRVPRLRADRIVAGLLEPDAQDIDVAGLHQAMVRIARRHNAEIKTSSPVEEITKTGNNWKVTAGDNTHSAPNLINAAGAWGDQVAQLGGVAPIGLEPRRRTAFMVPGSEDWANWPLLIDADHKYYFKPDGSQLLCSLGEEEPAPPGDPRPRVEDVALAIERINEATDLGIRTVNSQWVGLRTFAPDGNLVVGEDPDHDGFYWLVGQGGIGIATSPGYGSLLAALVTRTGLSSDLTSAGVDPSLLSPNRFR